MHPENNNSPRAAGEAAQLPTLPLIEAVDWESYRPRNDDRTNPATCAFRVACELPAGFGLTVIQRDVAAITIGHRWAAKQTRGEKSCALHEIAEHFGHLGRCGCFPCESKRRAHACTNGRHS